ncbi:protein of unknown function [Bacillus velezensis]|nr:protein of unknown function [Bacillus velezensis]
MGICYVKWYNEKTFFIDFILPN